MLLSMSNMADETTLTEEEIDSMDMRQCRTTSKERGIDTNGVNLEGLKDFRRLLKIHLAEGRQERENVIKHLQEHTDVDQRYRMEIRKMLAELNTNLQLWKTTAQPISERIDSQMPKLRKELEAMITDLTDEEAASRILVAGETGAGKSSFINLLLGDEILPCSLLTNTNVICEVSYKDIDHFQATLFPIDGSDPQEIVCAQREDFVKELERNLSIQYSIGDLMNASAILGKYKKAKIELRNDFLRTGARIVDSPGIGDLEDMNNCVLEYIQRAYSYIFIVNCPNCGGMQKDRLSLLLQDVKKKTFFDERFQPGNAIFVLNKWDTVEENRKEFVFNTIQQKIAEIWPHLRRGQLFTFCTKEGLVIQKQTRGRILLGSFSKIMNKIVDILPRGQTALVDRATELLGRVLARINVCVEGFHMPRKTPFSEEETVELYFKYLNENDAILKCHIKFVETQIKSTAKELSKFLKSIDFKTELANNNFFVDSIPENSDWDRAKFLISESFHKYLTVKIGQWEAEHKCFYNMTREIENAIKKKCPQLTKNVDNLSVICNQLSIFKPEGISYSHFFNLKQKLSVNPIHAKLTFLIGIGIAGTAPVILVSALFYASLLALESLSLKIQKQQLQSLFIENKAKAANKFLKIIIPITIKPCSLQSVLINEVKPLIDFIELQRVEMTRLVHMDIEILQNECKWKEIHKNIINPVIDSLCERLMCFSNAFELPWDLSFFPSFDPNDFTISGESSKSNGLLFDVQIVKDNLRNSFIVRKTKICINRHTIHDYMAEVKILFRPKNCNVVKSALGIYRQGNEMWLLFSHYHYNLKEYLIQTPGMKTAESEAVNCLLEGVMKGLFYLFQHGFVHIDLALENIMVDCSGQVCLMNIFRPKKLTYSIIPQHETVIDNPYQYIPFAKDILLAPLDTTYTYSHDLYALAIIMCEIAIGKAPFLDSLLHEPSLRDLAFVIKNSDIESHLKLLNAVEEKKPYWKKIIHDFLCFCCESIDDERIFNFGKFIRNTDTEQQNFFSTESEPISLSAPTSPSSSLPSSICLSSTSSSSSQSSFKFSISVDFPSKPSDNESI